VTEAEPRGANWCRLPMEAPLNRSGWGGRSWRSKFSRATVISFWSSYAQARMAGSVCDRLVSSVVSLYSTLGGTVGAVHHVAPFEGYAGLRQHFLAHPFDSVPGAGCRDFPTLPWAAGACITPRSYEFARTVRTSACSALTFCCSSFTGSDTVLGLEVVTASTIGGIHSLALVDGEDPDGIVLRQSHQGRERVAVLV